MFWIVLVVAGSLAGWHGGATPHTEAAALEWNPAERILFMDAISPSWADDELVFLTNQRLVFQDSPARSVQIVPLQRIRSIQVVHAQGFLDKTTVRLTLDDGHIDSFELTHLRAVEEEVVVVEEHPTVNLVDLLRGAVADSVTVEESLASAADVD